VTDGTVEQTRVKGAVVLVKPTGHPSGSVGPAAEAPRDAPDAWCSLQRVPHGTLDERRGPRRHVGRARASCRFPRRLLGARPLDAFSSSASSPQHLPGPPLPTATPSDATRPVSDLTSWHRSLGRPEGPHHAPETRISNGVNRASGFRGRPRRYRLPRNASDFRHIRNRRSSALGRTAGRFRVPRGDDPQTRRSGSPHDEKAQVRCPLRLVPKSPRTPHATSSGSRGFPLMEKVQVSGPFSSVGRPPPRSQRQTSVTIHASYRPL
jgi:hypothetical protein